MALDRAEKAAGRVFRDEQTAALLTLTDKLSLEAAEEGRDFYVVPPFLGKYRHLCPKRGNISTAMSLTEEYVYSPDYNVFELARRPPRDTTKKPEMIALPANVEMADGIEVVTVHAVPARRFGFVYKKGKCSCGATAQSRVGKLVDAYERPPLRGREAR